MQLNEIRNSAYAAAKELLSLQRPGFFRPRLLVVGCSSSEIAGGEIGHLSSPQIGAAVVEGVLSACKEAGCAVAFQCCEHLNRALIVENETAEKLGLEPVWVVPAPKAGGSLATAAWQAFSQPTAVEHIRADSGLDIGDTFIGMHLKDVAVPVRLSKASIGCAHLTAARCRPKLIGGERAKYTEEHLK